jgi:hypothetical protein
MIKTLKNKLISQKDKDVLRELARKVAGFSVDPANEQKADMWRRLNSLQRVRPLVHWHMEEFCWPEVLGENVFKVDNPELKKYEVYLRRAIWLAENIRDDTVFVAEIPYETVIEDSGNGLQIVQDKQGKQHGGSVTWVKQLEKEEDVEKIHNPVIRVDQEATDRNAAICHEIFDQILQPVTKKRNGWEFPAINLIDDLVIYRGMQQLYIDMIERRKWVHAVLEKLLTAKISRLEQYEKLNLLGLNNSYNEVGTSALGYTDELPATDFDGIHVRAKDLWGFSCAQSLISVGKDMHEEFAVSYERRYLGRFGLNVIACCEPVDKKMDIISTIPKLRLISISEWNDRETASKLLGKDYVFAYKPTGVYFAENSWDIEAARADMEDLFKKTRNNVLEVHHNACSTCRNQPQRIIDWVDMTMELATEYA